MTIPALVTALRNCPTAATLGLYKGYDWTKFVTDKYNSQFDIVKSKEWSLSFHRWQGDDDKRIEWWKHYEHSLLPIHNPLLVDDILIRKWQVKTVDFEAPIVTASTNGHMKAQNFSLHLFGRSVFSLESAIIQAPQVSEEII